MTRMTIVSSQKTASKLPINPQANPMAAGYSIDPCRVKNLTPLLV